VRALIQRVREASVVISDEVHSNISNGLLIFLGIGNEDESSDIEWLIRKICSMRIFNDDEGVMNLNPIELNKEFLVVSQFTLHASTKKGNRPSYIRAARPEQAIPLYQEFISKLQYESSTSVKSGQFGADMQITLINDGPVTIWLDSRNKE